MRCTKNCSFIITLYLIIPFQPRSLVLAITNVLKNQGSLFDSSLNAMEGETNFLPNLTSLKEGFPIFQNNNTNMDNSSNFAEARSLLVHWWTSVDLEEIHLTAPEIIMKRGYTFECHTVVTSDGYVLSLHRIPPAQPGAKAIVLFHGMFQTSRDFLMNEGRRPIALKLADAGYDVWLVNARGNSYSRKHTKYNVNDQIFWNFSVDEVIRYDAPAMIDYILSVTGQPSLIWIGYSLGTAVGLGLTSTIPEYNNKISLLFLLGTTAYVGNAKSPLLRLLAPFEKVQDVAMTTFNHGETLPWFLFPIMRTFLPILCLPEAKLNIPGFCSFFLFIVAGFNVDQANPRMIPIMLGGTPGSLAIKMLSQWYQWINCGRFTYFNYGDENLGRYGNTIPPSYDLTKVTTRVVNFWAPNDWLSVPKDVQRTVEDLPNVVMNVRVRMNSFNHLDFIYGKDADFYVYEQIIGIIPMFT